MWRKRNSVHCWWECKLVRDSGKMYESSLKVINRTTIWVRHSTFGICLKEMKLESCRISAPPSSLPIIVQFSSAQWLSRVWLFATSWTTAHQASLSITNARSSAKLMSIELVMSSNHIIFCCPLLLLPSIFPSIRVFSNQLALRMKWPKYWSFSFSINPSNEYSGLISFRMDLLDLLAVQGTLKSLLQHHSSKASIFPRSALTSIHDHRKNHSLD